MISRVLGLLREMTRTWLLGTSVLGEAFSAAFNVPNLFRKLLAEGAMSVALIPTMKGYFEEGDERKTREFLSATLTVLVFLLAIIISMGSVSAMGIARLYAGMARDASVLTDTAETAVLIRMMFPYLAFVSLAAFFQGILNTHGIFIPTGIGPILFNLSFLAVPPLLAGFMPNPARAMAVGVLVGGFLQAICQLPSVLKAGARFGFISIKRAFQNPGMKRIFILMAPTLLGTAAYELNAFVSTGLAYGVGSATSIQISLRLQELILGVFVVSIATVLLPELSRCFVRNDREGLVSSFLKALDGVILVSIPIAVFSILCRENIVAVLFQSGEFDALSVKRTSDAFMYHSAGLVFIAINRVIAPVFYAHRDTKNPSWAGIASFAVNILLAWVLSGIMGGKGIALALSVASAANSLILIIMMLRKKLPGMEKSLLSAFFYIIKLFLYSALAALPAYYVQKKLDAVFSGSSSRLFFAGLPLIGAALTFGTLGILILWLSRDRVAREFISSFRKKSR